MRVGEVPETVAGHSLIATGSPLERSAGFSAFVTLAGCLRGPQTDVALEGQPSMHGWFGPLAL